MGLASTTCAGFAISSLENQGNPAQVTESIKPHGKEILASIFRMTELRRNPIRCARFCGLSTDWSEMMNREIDRYTYRVTWSEEDQEHVGLCAEFPSLSWLEKTPEKALQGIRNLVRESIADMRKSREVVPEPIATKAFSGKFMVRIPPQIHRTLAIQAAESGISLNRLVSSKLS